MRKAAGLVAIALLMSTGVQSTALTKEQSAVAYVQSIYADHESPGGTARYTPRMQKLWDECFRIAKKNGDATWTFQ
jgi:hypothetical protein